MTTGTQIGNDLAVLFAHVATKLTDPVRLSLINMAVRAAWPKVKRTLFVESSATTPTTVDGDSSPTYVYTVVPQANTAIPPWGVSQVWVTPAGSTSDHDQMVRDVWQYQDDGTWYVLFSKTWVQKFDAETIKIMYQTIPADLTVLTDDIPCDPSFCLNYAAFMFASRLYSEAEASRAAQLGNVVALWKAEAEKAHKMMAGSPNLSIPTWNML